MTINSQNIGCPFVKVKNTFVTVLGKLIFTVYRLLILQYYSRARFPTRLKNPLYNTYYP